MSSTTAFGKRSANRQKHRSLAVVTIRARDPGPGHPTALLHRQGLRPEDRGRPAVARAKADTDAINLLATANGHAGRGRRAYQDRRDRHDDQGAGRACTIIMVDAMRVGQHSTRHGLLFARTGRTRTRRRRRDVPCSPSSGPVMLATDAGPRRPTCRTKLLAIADTYERRLPRRPCAADLREQALGYRLGAADHHDRPRRRTRTRMTGRCPGPRDCGPGASQRVSMNARPRCSPEERAFAKLIVRIHQGVTASLPPRDTVAERRRPADVSVNGCFDRAPWPWPRGWASFRRRGRCRRSLREIQMKMLDKAGRASENGERGQMVQVALPQGEECRSTEDHRAGGKIP